MDGQSIIKNRAQLETSELRNKALCIIEAGIKRVQPETTMQTALSFDRSKNSLSINGEPHSLGERVFVVGSGKASGLMAEALERILGEETIEYGIVVDKASPTESHARKIQIRQAGHPLPDERGMSAAKEILQMRQQLSIGERDTILALISGGASALMPLPLEGISLADKVQVTRLLLACGADIREVNTVRKHLSAIKGGRLAAYFAPTGMNSLILSDVVGNDLSVIASGPTFPDASTYSQALGVLERFDLINKAPQSVSATLEKGCRGQISETPKTLSNVDNHIIGDVRMALRAMAQKARQLGFQALILSSEQVGETEKVARERAQEIMSGRYAGYNALLIGGETTPTLPEKPGTGGRNQHYAAVTMPLMESYPGDWVVASVGTDGSDFMADVAGAIVDNGCLRNIKEADPDFGNKLTSYDSNTVLGCADDSLIVTGSTHTNVGDVVLYLLENRSG